MLSSADQLGNTLHLRQPPVRIISLVPSQSELLWALGLRGELKGITRFCIHPAEMFASVERVGGTKKLDIEKIRRLQPDLIIGNKEENEREQIELLQKEFNVWMSDIYTLADAMDMMQRLGTLLGKEAAAATLVASLSRSLANIKDTFRGRRVAYFIWNKPYMLAARHTFIDEVLAHLGFENAAAHLERYPEADAEALKSMSPAVCFLSSEPFPFAQKHVEELRSIVPHAKILIVDGEVFSWYGSRLLQLEKYVQGLKKLL